MILSKEEMIEYVGLRDDGYFRFRLIQALNGQPDETVWVRLIQALEKLAAAHGCECIDGQCACHDSEPYMNDE